MVIILLFHDSLSGQESTKQDLASTSEAIDIGLICHHSSCTSMVYIWGMTSVWLEGSTSDWERAN